MAVRRTAIRFILSIDKIKMSKSLFDGIMHYSQECLVQTKNKIYNQIVKIVRGG